jgi:hypothetical protein
MYRQSNRWPLLFVAFISLLMAQAARAAAGPGGPAPEKPAGAADADQRRFTEDQLRTFLDTEKDWLEESGRIFARAARSQNDPTAAPPANVGQLYQSCLDRHHISREEFESLGERTSEAFNAIAFLDGTYKSAVAQLDAQSAEQNRALADEQRKLDTYQDAQKNGWRVLNDQDRDALVKAALADQQGALDEVKQHAQDVSSAESEAAQHDADAKTAADQAKNPPADISADDREEFIQNKKNEADAARASAKEARVEESDAKKAEAESQAHADAAGQRAAHPEIPISEDDKSQARSDNASGIQSATAAIEDIKKRLASINQQRSAMEKSAKLATKNVPPENIELMRRYMDEYQQIQAQAAAETTTRPAS